MVTASKNRVEARKVTHKQFKIEVKKLKAEGKYKGVRDSKKGLTIVITKHHIKQAQTKDESYCVIAQALHDTAVNDCIMAVGHTIAKILDKETGYITRYQVSAQLRNGLIEFDKSGDWKLGPGIYHLAKPTGPNALRRNQSEELRKKADSRWTKFEQKFERGETNGEGITEFRGSPVPTRYISIIRK